MASVTKQLAPGSSGTASPLSSFKASIPASIDGASSISKSATVAAAAPSQTVSSASVLSRSATTGSHESATVAAMAPPIPPSSSTPMSGHSGRSNSSVAAVANNITNTMRTAAASSARRARRGSITFEAGRIESKHFNAKELQNLAKQFTAWTNKQNMMDREGFRKSLGLLGMVQDALLCHQLFRVFNRSGSGQINFEEYVSGLGVLMKGSLDEKLHFSFNMTDIDGSGEISFEELILTVDSMMRIYAGIMGAGQSGSIDKEKIRRVFAHLDRNRDGKISLEEYKNGMKRHPEFLNTLRGTELFRPLSGSSSSLRQANAKIDRMEHALSLILNQVYRAEDALNAFRELRSRGEEAADPTRVSHHNTHKRNGLGDVTPSSSPAGSPLKSKSKDATASSTLLGASTGGGGGEEDDDTSGSAADFALEEEEAMLVMTKALAKARAVAENLLPHLARPTTSSSPKHHHRQSPSHELRQVTTTPPPSLPAATASSTTTMQTPSASAPLTPTSTQLKAAESSTPTTTTGEEEEKTEFPFRHQPQQMSPLPSPPPAPIATASTVQARDPEDSMKMSSTQALVNGEAGECGSVGEESDEWAEDKDDELNGGLPPLPATSTKPRKGLTVYFGHKNWDLVVNVMKGIQMAVSRSAMEVDRPVSQYDFGVKEKYTLVSSQDSKYSSGGDHRTRFVDYAPFVFAKLREYFHIDHDEYMNSIGPGSMLSNLMLGSLSSLAEMGSEGKSGSFFYLSSDGRFLVKTVRKDEHKLLRHILPSYFRHMTKVGQHPDQTPDSMLTRIVGCHVVRSSKRSKTRTGAQKVYFVVMTNALETDLEVHRKYDLKGSWIGRKTSPQAREDPNNTMKDVDFTESQDRIFVDGKMKQQLMASLRRDATFLESHHIIDYSVLLGIHENSPASSATLLKERSDSSLSSSNNHNNHNHTNGSQPPNTHRNPQRSPPVTVASTNSLVNDAACNGGIPQDPPFFAQYHGGFRSSDLKQTYFMGIIDFLTQYGERKRLERFVKTIAHLNASGLSVMPARAYAKRFLNFMDQRVIAADVDRTQYFASLASPAQNQVSTDIMRHPRLE